MDIRVMSQSAARGANPKLAKEGRGSRGEMSTVLMMLLVLAAHGACSEGYVKNVDVMSQQSPVYVAFRATRNDYSCGDNALISEESECKAAATALGKLPYHESGAWENAPRGCLFDVRGTFYNTHATGGCSGNCGSLGMTPICVRRSNNNRASGDNTVKTETAAHYRSQPDAGTPRPTQRPRWHFSEAGSGALLASGAAKMPKCEEDTAANCLGDDADMSPATIEKVRLASQNPACA